MRHHHAAMIHPTRRRGASRHIACGIMARGINLVGAVGRLRSSGRCCMTAWTTCTAYCQGCGRTVACIACTHYCMHGEGACMPDAVWCCLLLQGLQGSHTHGRPWPGPATKCRGPCSLSPPSMRPRARTLGRSSTLQSTAHQQARRTWTEGPQRATACGYAVHAPSLPAPCAARTGRSRGWSASSGFTSGYKQSQMTFATNEARTAAVALWPESAAWVPGCKCLHDHTVDGWKALPAPNQPAVGFAAVCSAPRPKKLRWNTVQAAAQGASRLGQRSTRITYTYAHAVHSPCFKTQHYSTIGSSARRARHIPPHGPASHELCLQPTNRGNAEMPRHSPCGMHARVAALTRVKRSIICNADTYPRVV